MILEVILFSLVLSIDSFSAALAMGFRHFSRKRAFVFAFSSGFTEGVATALGFVLGRVSQSLIVDYDHWIAFILLLLVGGHMCYQAYEEMHAKEPQAENTVKVHGLVKILLVSSITSIDSLGVGVSLGLLNKPIAIYSITIGICAFISTYLGLFLARKISNTLGSQVEFLGGVVLILLGIKMLSI